MKTYKVDAMLGRKVTSSTSVEAQSHVHDLVKTISRPLMPGTTPGKPWIRVTDVSTRKVHKFQFAH
ncbi:hypothetical protein [Mesorhizobium loti]|uniref:hypothetical protein n=1 Tax=Rhizobium loti TaxID=381 RepID=UPI00047D1244|nr:hypothetical protein [Mesorhizobium loti]